MTAKTLMVMGTSSSAGKSLLTTALCRCLARTGLRVAPFKAQNMSNNAAVCADGAEIGRSQALQAIAAGIAPQADMNPILLKPEGDTRSQVIVDGRPHQTSDATDYYARREQLWPHVTAALDRLRRQVDVVVIEGAGSPAELNLADVEMVNMSVARYSRAAVLLVGDIERGGVFAQLLGTLWLLPPEDRELVRGLIVNKFRGDLSLFDSGIDILRRRGGVPVLGVLPWIDALRLPEEDAVALDTPAGKDLLPSGDDPAHSADHRLDIAVVRLPHIANFDDFDPLASEPSVRLRYVRHADQLGRPDVLILPGTKNTLGDLDWLRRCGLAQSIRDAAQTGAHVVGICGGYQMLGRRIDNPLRLEANIDHAEALGLLDITTTFGPAKLTRQARFRILDDAIAPGTKNQTVGGYEIHCGQSTTAATWLEACPETSCSETPVAADRGAAPLVDGCYAREGRVWGCYLHGLFHNDAFRRAWLVRLGAANSTPASSSNDHLQQSLDRLADAFAQHIPIDQVLQMLDNPSPIAETQHA